MKKIVILAHFCRDFSFTDNGRFMFLCKELSKDNMVEIVTTDFDHGSKKHKKPSSSTIWPFKITYLHEPGYKRNISLSRFVSHKIWGNNVKKYLKSIPKPDVIYCAVPSLTGPYYASKFCKKNDVRFIIDIQDLWPEAFRLAFNLPILSDALFSPIEKVANMIYANADQICGVSKTYVNRALSVNKLVNEAHVVFLGTSVKTFDKFSTEYRIEKKDKNLWIGYCGTLGASYDITIIIDSLAVLKEKGVQVPKFIILGDGEKREAFQKYAQDRGIDCLFTGRLPYEKMCGWLRSCDIAVNPIKQNAAQSIINKHGDYASAGIPVINTQLSQEYRDLVEEYNMGFNCDNDNPEKIAEKIQILIEDLSVRKQMGENARKCAEERFDRDHTYEELINCILEN